MPNYDINSATTTDYKGTVADVTISPVTPDSQGTQEEIVWDFPDADQHNGYYNEIPEINSALHVKSQRVCGLGYVTDTRTQIILENIRGAGNEIFDAIIQQMFEESDVFGDVFAEQIHDEDGDLLNLKKLYTGDMRVIWNKNALIERYEKVKNNSEGKTIKFRPEQILHISNKRVGSEIHGKSIIPTLKRILDAKNQAFQDEITIRHRDKALGIVYYDTDDKGKISYANSQIEKGVNKGEMIGLPKDTAEIKEFPNKSPADRIAWLQYLDNLFYQIVGTPKVLVTSEGYTEAGGKAGLLAFEPTEISSKIKLEAELKSQLGIIIKFNRSPSLLGNEQETQSKNAGQTGIQPNETMMSPTRTE